MQVMWLAVLHQTWYNIKPLSKLPLCDTVWCSSQTSSWTLKSHRHIDDSDNSNRSLPRLCELFTRLLFSDLSLHTRRGVHCV
jgi:hypothetical protein